MSVPKHLLASLISHYDYAGGPVASASLSSDGTYIAISDLSTGFEVYEMGTEVVYRSFEHDVGEPFPTPVLFIHNGNALVGGSTVGKVNIWDIHGMGKMHSLTIPKRAKVLALAAHYSAGNDASSYEFYVATGIMKENSTSYCIIWKTETLGTGQMAEVGNMSDKNPPSEPVNEVGGPSTPAIIESVEADKSESMESSRWSSAKLARPTDITKASA
ncbi:hypothetical protein BD311DRAFT_811285 [Dichomitus squalens]|uniref:WD40-repeat-containing domain protein n=1 Tax=Dichomitus squalens TaxID=114155 RepID=A0A4Q9M9V1_9APHY|nr:hypothetical protein BD311DRAFT_811285 [Dichomitus squalens]